MRRQTKALRLNCNWAQTTWGELSPSLLEGLEYLTDRYGLSVALGDLQQIDGRWYVTHPGLLRIAQRRRCQAIRIALQKDVSDPIANRWVFRATVHKTSSSRGFVGYGDANPSNVPLLVRGAEMRIAETRAVNRALRKAYGLCSVEELGSPSSRFEPTSGKHSSFLSGNGNGSSSGQPKLRDRLCLLIRKFELDPNLVKRYAADFCGTEVLRDAGRDLVESFITTLADEAAKDRGALICKLNSYGHAEAVSS